MSSSYESTTKTTETGAFIRVTVRKGKKRKQKTQRIKKSDKKVILGKLGDFEVYLYPYDFPDKVFLGKFPVSTMMETAEWKEFLRVGMRIKAYFEGHYFSEPKKRKGANARKRAVKKAYDSGLLDVLEGEMKRKKARYP